MQKLLSGVKPTGNPHIGNYFGAMKQFVDLQGNYDCHFMIADYHALNFIKDGSELRHLTIELTKDFLAIGLDPKKAVIFKQSDVPEHTELCWIFDTITTVPYLMRAHAYKDKVAKHEEVRVGSFNYPMLMAADILLYDTDVVPVGQDQKQHIEYARDTAEKFNNTFGETFKLPKEIMPKEVALVPGTDGQKMSKSYDNTITLFASRDEIVKAVMSIVTDSKGERPEHVYAIHKLFRDETSLNDLYETNKNNYKVLKEALIEDIDAFIAPLREARKEISDADIVSLLEKSGAQARETASAKMADVRQKIGVSL